MFFRNKVTANALWIIGCRIAQAVLALFVNIFTARYLGPSNYGLISYAASIVAFFTPLMQLGINNVLVNEIINNPEKEGEVVGSSLVLTLFSSVCCIGGCFVFVSLTNPFEKETILVCVLYSLILLFQSMEIIQYWFQAKYLSKYVSLSMLGAYVIVAAYKIFLLITQKSIYWFAVSNAFDICLIAVSLLILYKKKGGQRLSFSFDRVKRLFSVGKYYIVSSMMVTIFAQTDKVMLKMIADTEAVGCYAAAVTVANLSGFVFAAIIDSMRPLILEYKSKGSTELYELNLSRLYSIVIYLALAQCVFMTLFSKYIVSLLYGADYMASVSALRIVVWYTTFAYIGSIRNVWILAEGKQKYLWIINLSGALTNILLNAFLIPLAGVNGAAFASLVTQIFTNVVLGYIIRPIAPNNRIMMGSINPQILINTIKGRKNNGRIDT